MSDAAPDYAVPALDKALDILELLASEAGGLTQSAIAEATGRTIGQIFRVLSTLERRGYVFRDRQSGLYLLSMAVFDLAHRQQPLRGLIQLSLGPMRALAERVAQSCNLSVLDADRVRVVAQVESPADFGYRVRVGALFRVESTATGAVLVAGAEPDVRERFALQPPPGLDRGYYSRPDPLQAGITDIVVPIVGREGVTVAALTVPYVATTFSAVDAQTVISAALEAGVQISQFVQGTVSP